MTDQTITLPERIDALVARAKTNWCQFTHRHGQDREAAEAIDELAALARSAAPTAGAEDSALLDWLDAQRENESHADHVGDEVLDYCYWQIQAQSLDLRSAIRAAMLSHPDRTSLPPEAPTP